MGTQRRAEWVRAEWERVKWAQRVQWEQRFFFDTMKNLIESSK